MPHMVIFRDAEGRPGYHHADQLEDAVSFVEHLRNEQRVSDTRVFSKSITSWRTPALSGPEGSTLRGVQMPSPRRAPPLITANISSGPAESGTQVVLAVQ